MTLEQRALRIERLSLRVERVISLVKRAKVQKLRHLKDHEKELKFRRMQLELLEMGADA